MREVPASSLIEKLDSVCNVYLLDQTQEIRNKLPKTCQPHNINHQLQVSKITFKIVDKDIMLTKALLMVFAASGLLPSSNDVLFCSEKTPQTIIE